MDAIHCDLRMTRLMANREMKRVIAAAALCASLVAVASAHSTPNRNIGQCRMQVEQVQLHEARRYTLRDPCMVFKNPRKTKAYMRALLLRNGFSSVGIPAISSRRFRFGAVKDGIQVAGIVAKTGKRQLLVKKWFASGPVRMSTVTTPFEA
jgi:hypothetical protein